MALIDKSIGIFGRREGGATTWIQVTFDKFDEANSFNIELVDLLLRYSKKSETEEKPEPTHAA